MASLTVVKISLVLLSVVLYFAVDLLLSVLKIVKGFKFSILKILVHF